MIVGLGLKSGAAGYSNDILRYMQPRTSVRVYRACVTPTITFAAL